MSNKNKSVKEVLDRQSIWETFLSAKEQMLYEFELAKKFSNSHIVQVFHGKVAEGIFRKWLSRFLPKRFEVTSGYIVPPNTFQYPVDYLSHFDVIIYDAFSSPILWIENNPDNSQQGSSRAIPLEYVYAVIEVKSQMNPKTVKEAINKIEELRPFLEKTSTVPNLIEGVFLPRNFYTGIVFFELTEKYKFKQQMLDDLLPNDFLRGYVQSFPMGNPNNKLTRTHPSYCGLVLKGENLDPANSGLISIVGNENKHPVTNKVSLLGEECIFSSKGKKYPSLYSDELNFYVNLYWDKNSFSEFAFHLVNRINGISIQGGSESLYGTSNFFSDWLQPSSENHTQNS